MKHKSDEAHLLTDAELEKLERRIASEYKKAADELTDKINAYFESFKKRDEETKKLIGTIVNGREYTEKDYQQWRLAQIGRGKRFEALRDRIAERMTHANKVAAAYINDQTPGIYSLNRNYAAYTIEQQAGANVGFDLWDEQTVRRLLVEQPNLMPYYPPERAVKRGIDLAYGKRQITAQVTSGILQGESIKHLADRLQTNIPNMNRDSAIRVARTAVTGAQNAGRQDSYDAAVKMGIEMEKQWLATLDGRTRHDHAMADGQIAGVDEPFTVGGEKLMFPGDPSGSGWNIYNCRCTQIAKVKGVDMSDAKRRAVDPVTGESEVVSNMTYQEWYAMKEKQHGKAEMETARKKAERESSDRKQFEEYRAALGKNAPKTFADFQDLKYNKGEEWDFMKLDYRRRNELKKHPETSLPHANNVKIPDSKFEKYLFNPENPKGWDKGQAFISRLGYSKKNYKALQAEIRAGAKQYSATKKEEDQFGIRYEQQMILYGESGTPANVIISWICKPDGSTSMTSAYIKEVKSW